MGIHTRLGSVMGDIAPKPPRHMGERSLWTLESR